VAGVRLGTRDPLYVSTNGRWLGGGDTNQPTAETTAPASYVGDATRDFSDTVESLFVRDRADCVSEQPGGVRWQFQRNGPRWAGIVPRHDARASFCGEDAWLRFSSKVGKQLDHLLAPAAGSDT
jgi:hypothetical protein